MKNKLYEILRKYVAWRATFKLGKVEITKDEIICYVDEKKLKNKEKYLHRYNLMFHFIPKNEEIYNIYKVDKPVHYIVRNVDFDMEIKIMAAMKDCHVTFENCTFTAGIEIDFADHLTFKNNIYRAQKHKNYNSIHKAGEFCISTYDRIAEVNKLEFINEEIDISKGVPIMNINDLIYPTKKSKLQLWLYAKNVILDSSEINAKNMEIAADTVTLIDSDISAKEIEIKANKIVFDDATISADVITIDSPSIEGKLSMCHEGLFINGVEVDKNEAITIIENYDLALQKQRLELINSLKKIQSTCEERIAEQIKQQPLTRVLKK